MESRFPKPFLRFEQYTSPKQYHRKQGDEKETKNRKFVLEIGLKRIKNNHQYCDLSQGFSDELRPGPFGRSLSILYPKDFGK